MVAVSIIQIIECTNVLCFTFRVTSILIKITSLDKEPLFGKRANGSRTWGTRNLKKKKPIDTLSDPRINSIHLIKTVANIINLIETKLFRKYCITKKNFAICTSKTKHTKSFIPCKNIAHR